MLFHISAFEAMVLMSVFRNGHGFGLSGYSEERCSEYQTPHAAKCFIGKTSGRSAGNVLWDCYRRHKADNGLIDACLVGFLMWIIVECVIDCRCTKLLPCLKKEIHR